MVLLKALLIGLTGASLCMANISGTVTDTGTTPIYGAVVQLEKGGQTATTDVNGQFTLVVGGTAILPGNNTTLPNGLSSIISGNVITVTIAQRAAVEVAIFDLTGKVLSTVRKTLDAGNHSISFPYGRTGIYLYKVKSGNSEFVLKENSVSGASSGISVSSQGLSSNRLAKQAKAAAEIDDIITAQKAGYLNFRSVIYNDDTSGIRIKMIANAGNLIDRDGNAYQTVRIGNQVWTVENLRVKKFNDGSAILLDTSTATWNSDTTPKYCFYNNTTNADSIKKYGAFYNWFVVNTGKLAPAGWHVPSNADWDTLQNYLIAKGYNWDGTTTGNKIGKSMAAKTDWSNNYYNPIVGDVGVDLTKNNSTGFSALPCGSRGFTGEFAPQGYSVDWWSVTASQYNASDANNSWLLYDSGSFFSATFVSDNNKNNGFSVRLVSD